MNSPDNKQIVSQALHHLLSLRLDEAASLISDHVEWTYPADGAQRGRILGKQSALSYCQLLKRFFPNGVQLSVDTLIAEDDTVVAEYHYVAETALGDRYENYYCSIFELSNGKIEKIREHVDTAYAARLLGDLLPSS